MEGGAGAAAASVSSLNMQDASQGCKRATCVLCLAQSLNTAFGLLSCAPGPGGSHAVLVGRPQGSAHRWHVWSKRSRVGDFLPFLHFALQTPGMTTLCRAGVACARSLCSQQGVLNAPRRWL